MPEEAGPKIEASEDTPYSAGFVFVHGIGAQKAGHTLASFEGPFRRTVQRIFPTLSIESVLFGETEDEPARAEWVIANGTVYCRWLLVEARWADSFLPPDSLAFIAWIRKVQFWLIAFHFSGALILRLHSVMLEAEALFSHRRWKSLAARILIILSMPLWLVWAFLWRLAAIPVVLALLRCVLRLRRVSLAKSIASRISAFLGDSFALIADENAEAAMLARVRRDYEWCSSQTPWTVLVAHSQGAYLSRKVLAQAGSSNTTFVTLGAGIGILHALQRGWVKSAYAHALPFIGLLFAQVVLTLVSIRFVLPWRSREDASLRVLMEHWRCLMTPSSWSSTSQLLACSEQIDQNFWPLIATSLLVGLIVFVVLVVLPNLIMHRVRIFFSRMGLVDMWLSRSDDLALPPNAADSWTDFSSSQDPVSMGALLDGAADASLLVSNGFLPLLEHNRYHRNEGILCYIAYVASSLLPVEDAERSTALGAIDVEFARQIRRMRAAQVLAAALGLAVLLAVSLWGASVALS